MAKHEADLAGLRMAAAEQHTNQVVRKLEKRIEDLEMLEMGRAHREILKRLDDLELLAKVNREYDEQTVKLLEILAEKVKRLEMEVLPS